MRTGLFLSALAATLAAALLGACNGRFCLTASDCESWQACIGGFCTDATGTSSGQFFPDVDGGAGDGGELDGSVAPPRDGGGSTSSSTGGTADAGPPALTLPSAPTAITLSDNGMELWVAYRGTASPLDRAERYVLPLPSSPGSTVGLARGGQDCAPTAMVQRGNHLFAGCGNGKVRGMTLTGTAVGAEGQVGTPVVAVDHAQMVVFASGGDGSGQGVVAFRDLGGTPQVSTPLPPSSWNNGHRGIGLVENSSGAVVFAVVSGVSGTDVDVQAHLGSGDFDTSPSAVETGGNVSRIASGRRSADANPAQPVVLLDVFSGTARVWLGEDLAANRAAVKTVSSLGLAASALQNTSRLRVKVSRDSTHAYLVSTEDKVCRVSLEVGGAAAAECRDIPSHATPCSPSDVAPRVGSGHTYVSCSSSRKVVAIQDF